MRGAACLALVGVLPGEQCCCCMEFCGCAEAAAGLCGGDVASPEGDIEEENLEVDVRAPVH